MAAVIEWRATKANAPGREAIVGDPDDWQRALASMESVLEKLTSVPASDMAAWRGAAREAAGVFAAWSRRFEGEDPGTLAAGADALARSAQYRSGDPMPNRAVVSDLRGIAAIVAQSQLSNHSPMAWAMLVDQLGRTLRAIGDAHVARGEAQMAKALVDNLLRPLEQLHDRFESSSPHELVPGE